MLEFTSIQIKLCKNTTLLSAVCRSSNSPLDPEDLTTITNHNGPVVIAGDLNAKHTN